MYHDYTICDLIPCFFPILDLDHISGSYLSNLKVFESNIIQKRDYCCQSYIDKGLGGLGNSSGKSSQVYWDSEI